MADAVVSILPPDPQRIDDTLAAADDGRDDEDTAAAAVADNDDADKGRVAADRLETGARP